MSNPLGAETIALVKATIPALEAHGTDITTAMYARLFQDEHIKALFNHSNQGESGAQVHALASAILAYARNIENPGVLLPVVERIAHKHVGYHILPEHYPFVATALLGAIKQVLGDVATDEILAAWGKAYWFLADILKDREEVLRRELSEADGGWSGWRKFVVTEKTRESDVITSFVLKPQGGGSVSRHLPGQYLTFRFDAPGQPGMKRNYSISCAPNNDHYRISVKREEHGQGGSRHLHDTVNVGDMLEATPPAGDFFLSTTPKRPVVLVSGGVGLTPMVSMLETIADEHPDLETHYVHGALNSASHAMDTHVRSLAKNHGCISVSTFYSEPAAGDAVGTTHDHEGFISAAWLNEHVPLKDADVFLCGPKPFLNAMVRDLTQSGLPADQLHYELFGPTDEEIAA
ncbi:MAG: flavohemoprotein [Nitrospirales bacterium]|nr:MAG: flavohemoprotein [Nitrospirales bacterium]